MRLTQIVVEMTNLWADTELNLDCFFVFVVVVAARSDDLAVSVEVVYCSSQPMY